MSRREASPRCAIAEIAIERFTGEADVRADHADRRRHGPSRRSLTFGARRHRKRHLDRTRRRRGRSRRYPEPHPRIGADELEAASVTKSAAAQAQASTSTSSRNSVSITSRYCAGSVGCARRRQSARQGRPRRPDFGRHMVELCSPLRRQSVGVGARQPLSVSSAISSRRFPLIRSSTNWLSARRRENWTGVTAHLFSFGGIAPTARWLCAVRGPAIFPGRRARVSHADALRRDALMVPN